MTNFLFLWRLVSTARKCLLSLIFLQFTPMMKCTVCNTQITLNLTHRLFTTMKQLYRFHLKFTCIRSLCLLHDLCPFCVGFTLPSLYPSLLRVKTRNPRAESLPGAWCLHFEPRIN